MAIKNCATTLACLILTLIFASQAQAQIPANFSENMCGTKKPVPELEFYNAASIAHAALSDSNKIKYVRLAFHYLLPVRPVTEKFVNDCDPARPTMNYFGAGNFTEYGDGWNDHDYTGYDFAEDLVANANFEFAFPSVQWRQDSNSVYPDSADPVKMQYLIAGVYFHRDSEAYYNAGSTIARERTHTKYQVEEERIINIYLTPNLPHSGVANGVGSVIKYVFLNMYGIYKKNGCQNWVITSFGPGVINHEIGHCFNLKHTWTGNDGCDDTPDGFEYDHINNPNKPTQCYGDTCCKKRANCAKYDPSIPGCPLKPCDEWSKISNNGMDGNFKFPHAYTPCQIDRINNSLMGEGSAYIYASEGGPPAQAFFNIPKSITCQGQSDVMMHTNGTFNAEEYRYVISQVESASDIYSGHTYSGNTYNSGWISGLTEKISLGERYNFQSDSYYRVTLFVNNSVSVQEHSYSKVIYVKECYQELPFISVKATNPIDETLHFNYTTTTSGTVKVFLINVSTGHLTVVLPKQSVGEGTWSHSAYVGQLPPGAYCLSAIINSTITQKLVVKL